MSTLIIKTKSNFVTIKNPTPKDDSKMRKEPRYQNVLYVYIKTRKREYELNKLDHHVLDEAQRYGTVKTITPNHSKGYGSVLYHEYHICYDDERDAEDAFWYIDDRWVGKYLWKCKLVEMKTLC